MSSAAAGVVGGSARARVVHAFRTLLRAQRTAFEADTFMQTNARKQIRQHFDSPMPTKAVGAAALDEQLQRAEEATDFLLTSVIQAKKKANGKFVMNLQPRHTVPDPPEKQ